MQARTRVTKMESWTHLSTCQFYPTIYNVSSLCLQRYLDVWRNKYFCHSLVLELCSFLSIFLFALVQVSEDQFNSANIEGFTPLHYAAGEGNLQICQYLVETCNCDPQFPDNLGLTPGFCAVLQGRKDVAEYLLLVLLLVPLLMFICFFFCICLDFFCRVCVYWGWALSSPDWKFKKGIWAKKNGRTLGNVFFLRCIFGSEILKEWKCCGFHSSALT